MSALLLKADTIFFIYVDVFIIRYDTQHRDAADILKHAAPLVKESHVAAKLIDDDALDELSVLRGLQHDAAIYGGKDTAPVDIAHKNDIGPCMPRHR